MHEAARELLGQRKRESNMQRIIRETKSKLSKPLPIVDPTSQKGWNTEMVKPNPNGTYRTVDTLTGVITKNKK